MRNQPRTIVKYRHTVAVGLGCKVEGSDWFRIARVYAEAEEWSKAHEAFDRALVDVGDDSGVIEYGALANIYKRSS